jgi:hypothetical protein
VVVGRFFFLVWFPPFSFSFKGPASQALFSKTPHAIHSRIGAKSEKINRPPNQPTNHTNVHLASTASFFFLSFFLSFPSFSFVRGFCTRHLCSSGVSIQKADETAPHHPKSKNQAQICTRGNNNNTCITFTALPARTVSSSCLPFTRHPSPHLSLRVQARSTTITVRSDYSFLRCNVPPLQNRGQCNTATTKRSKRENHHYKQASKQERKNE